MQTASKYRWSILTMLFLAMIINYMDRSALSVAMPFVSKSFELTPSEKGMVFSSFFIGYAIFNFVGGYLADRYGPRRVMICTMVVWSIFCGLTSMAYSFWSLFILRALFGIGEGPISTTCNKATNNWFPIVERARAIGINQAGGPLGGALAGPVVGFVALSFGWQTSFVVIACFGLIWAVAWTFMSTDRPETNPRVNAAELAVIKADAAANAAAEAEGAVKPRLTEIIFRPAVLVMGLSLFCYNYILFFFMTWFPTYLVEAKGLSLQGMSIVTMLPWAVSATCFMSGGVLIDAVYKRTGRLLFSRKLVLVSCFFVASVCVALTGLASSVVSAVALMTVGVGFLNLACPAYWTVIQDIVPPSQVGTAGGFMHGLANLSGIVGPTATGFIIQLLASYSGGFYLAGGLGVIGALVVAFFVKPARRPVVATGGALVGENV
jgi:ACS family hexuronate transporter-like MFS transporter